MYYFKPYDEWRKEFLASHGLEEVEGGILFHDIFYAWDEYAYCICLAGYHECVRKQWEGKRVQIVKSEHGNPVLRFPWKESTQFTILDFNKEIVLMKEADVKEEWFQKPFSPVIDGYVIKEIGYFLLVCVFSLFFRDFYAGIGFMIVFTGCGSTNIGISDERSCHVSGWQAENAVFKKGK